MTSQPRLETVRDIPRLEAVRALCDATWPSPEGTQVTPNLLRALEHSGGHVGAAYLDDRLVGATVAFVGRERGTTGGAWHSYLHSHMAAVSPDARDRGIGTALKLHQRAWALAHDLDEIRWTFDPLVRRNAHLNVVRLGVDVAAYLPDFYGEMDDAVNAGDRSDRMIAAWRLTSARAVAAGVEGGGAALPVESLRAEGAVEGVYVRHGRPVADVPDPARPLLVRIPPDVASLRALDPDLALAWRMATRAVLAPAVDAGRPLLGMTDDGQYAFGRQP